MYDRLGLGVQGFDVDAARCRLDPHLATADDAVEPTLVPEVGEIGPEDAEAVGRQLEVERLGQGEERHSMRAVDRKPRRPPRSLAGMDQP